MVGKQVGDILAQAQQFHQDLSRFYDNLEKVADRERVKMLLKYFSHQEQALQESLRDFEASIGQEVLSTWYKFPPESEGKDLLERLHLEPSMTVNQVVEIALALIDCLAKVYQTAAETAPTEEVREVFRHLLRLADRQRDRLQEQGEAVKDL
ncbi:MAG: Ferritin-like protein [Candidatus Ozemobacter sibiricus]|jgi:rubrerythrin|uniref:Ferritin-like protein n=1 Tax=Candidatus Ozemobacter sibiricus TaxID=2268124 RepID=A0A367ZRL3_9BACT|nr:MAG: Ferritin-like protein [Candidatus Ozemobacter sibiricus]